jgi:hypothetical protein
MNDDNKFAYNARLRSKKNVQSTVEKKKSSIHIYDGDDRYTIKPKIPTVSFNLS